MNSKHNKADLFKNFINDMLDDHDDTVDGVSCKIVHPMVIEETDKLIIDKSALGSYLTPLEHQVRDCLTTELTQTMFVGFLMQNGLINDVEDGVDLNNPDLRVTLDIGDLHHALAFATACYMTINKKIHARFGSDEGDKTERMRKAVQALRILDEFARTVAADLPEFYSFVNEALEGVEDVDDPTAGD